MGGLPALLLAAAALVIAALPQQVIVAQEMDVEESLRQPTNLSTSVTSTSITLSWDAVSGASGYDVKQGADGTETAVSSGTSHTFNGLTAGTEYTLYVRSKNGSGTSDWASTTATTTSPATTPSSPLDLNAPTGDLSLWADASAVVRLSAAPETPSGLNAIATSTSLTLTWEGGLIGLTAYEVKLSASGSPTAVAWGTAYQFTDLTAATTYILYVRAKNDYGTSDWAALIATTAPAAPSGLSATATSTTITLIWNAVAGATSYDVKQGAGGTVTAASSDTSHTFSGLTANTAYTLYARTVSGDETSDWASLSVTTAPAAPGIYGLYQPGNDRSSLGLNWSAAAGATGYQVKIGPDGAPAPATADTWHVFSGLTLGAEYTFYVRAVNSWGASAWSKSATTQGTVPPAAPTGLSAAAGADLKLSWTAARLSDTTVYQVKLNADGAATAADAIDSHTYSDLSAGTEYTLYVRARNSGGVSDWSSVSAATVPAAPSGLSAATTNTSLTLSWSAVTGATSYDVKQGENGTVTAVSSGTSHTFSGLSAGTTYTLYARARNSGGVSDWTSTTATTVLPAPSGLSAVATSTTITLSWGAVSGASGYDVKQGSGGTVTAVSSGTSHTFSGLTANAAYTLYVRASNSGGVSDWTSTTATAVLAAPSNLSASVSIDQYRVVKSLSLSWDSVAGATAYEVKLGENRAAITVLATEYRFSYQDYGSDALLDTVYVRAKNSDGFSAWQSARAQGPSYPIGPRPTLPSQPILPALP